MSLPVNQIVQGDCLEIMKELPDKCVDLVVTDPPYGVRKKEEWDNRENFILNANTWLSECLRIAPIVIWFCADKMLPCLLKDREDVFHRLLIWNKPNGSQFGGTSNSNIWYSLEPILVFGEYPKEDKSKRYGFATFTYRTIPHAVYDHPTTKPIGLMKELLHFYSNEDDLILDPFAGSGTTLVAAKGLGRRYIGIEQKPEYVDMANARLDSVNLDLFIDVQ